MIEKTLRCKTAMKIDFKFIRKKKLSFIADTELQVDQIRRKMEAKFKAIIFLNINYFQKSKRPWVFKK